MNTIVKHCIQIACLIFVAFQAYQCVKKYADWPQGTHASLQKASKYPYPDITICPYPSNGHFNATLENCNLTIEDYFENAIWIGNNSDIDYCNNPKDLCEILGENTYEQMDKVKVNIYDFNGNTLTYSNNTNIDFWVEKETRDSGKCLTFQMPKNREIWCLHFWCPFGKYEAYFSAPGDFIATYDYTSILVSNNHMILININHEVFQALSTEEQACHNDYIRDECIDEFVTQKMMQIQGCTTPFVTNKSHICTDPDKAKKALAIQSDILDGDREILVNACPKSCVQVRMVFGSQRVDDIGLDDNDVPGELSLYFQHTIEVSKSYWSYTGLSLFAEIGGYVGLFLGVSLHQVSNILEKILMYKRNI